MKANTLKHFDIFTEHLVSIKSNMISSGVDDPISSMLILIHHDGTSTLVILELRDDEEDGLTGVRTGSIAAILIKKAVAHKKIEDPHGNKIKVKPVRGFLLGFESWCAPIDEESIPTRLHSKKQSIFGIIGCDADGWHQRFQKFGHVNGSIILGDTIDEFDLPESVVKGNIYDELTAKHISPKKFK